MFIPIPPEIEDRRALVEAINDRLEELDKPLTADRVLLAVPGERNDSRKTVMLDLQSTLFDLIGNTEKTISLDGDAIFGGDSWDEMTGGGNTTLHKHDIYGELAQDETITGDWTFTDTLLVKSTAADTDAALTVQSLAANAEAMVVIKGIGSATAYGYSALRLQSDEATDHEWRISHDAGGANLLLFGYGTIAGGSSFYSFGTTGVFSCGAVTIGANTLDTNEWAYLDGQDQALKTSDLAVFDKIGINTATVPSGGTAHTSTGLSLNNRYFELLASGIDAYPMVHIDALGHDNIYLLFDAYPKDTGDFWRSSDAGSNFGISKSGDKLNFLYDSAIAAGNAITWNTALSLDTSGNMLVNGTGQTQYGAATEYINGPGSSVLALNAGATISMNAGVEIHHGTVDGGLSIYESDEGNVAFEMLANTNRGIFKMYASGVVTFQFNSAASAAAISYFNTGGHYGFNTTTPDDTLEIVPHAADTGLTVREFDDGNDAIRIRASNTRGTIAVMSNNANTWFFNGGPTSDSYFNPSTGGFIIGGTSTTVNFEVDGTARMTGTGHYEYNDAGTYVYSRAPTFLSLVADGQIELNGDVGVLGQNELRFYEGANYIGFEAPALAADQIWVLPPADGITGEVLTTDGAGNLSWTANASEKTWAFKSRDANTGTNYIGGFYKFATSANDFNPATTFGTANASYAAHFFFVQAAGASGGTDTVIRVTGTSIDDQGNRTAADFEDVAIDDAGAAGTYYETTAKWIGQVSIEKQSGPDLLCNYGFCKYWDNNNTDFKVVGIEATWLGAQNDATPDILLRHHTATGWTYNAGAAPTPPAAIVSMAGDHVTEIQIRTDEEGAWKRDNLSTDVDGSGIEGTIVELVTTANRTYAIGNFLVRITPQ